MPSLLPEDYNGWPHLGLLDTSVEQLQFEDAAKTVGAVLDKYPNGTYSDPSTLGAFKGWLMAKSLGVHTSAAGATLPIQRSRAHSGESVSPSSEPLKGYSEGPWVARQHVHECEQGLWYVCDARGRKIATHLSSQADAQLIASAPRLAARLAQVPTTSKTSEISMSPGSSADSASLVGDVSV
jgi:hypothetical protein